MKVIIGIIFSRFDEYVIQIKSQIALPLIQTPTMITKIIMQAKPAQNVPVWVRLTCLIRLSARSKKVERVRSTVVMTSCERRHAYQGIFGSIRRFRTVGDQDRPFGAFRQR